MSDFAALQTLLALRDQGSLTRAAQLMNCPKSTLSRRLAILEDELGQRLTQQQNGRLLLTEAGMRYAEYGERILQLAAEGRQALQALDSNMSGCLHVRICPEMARGWSSSVFASFLARYPDIQLDIRLSERDFASADSETDLWLSCHQMQIPGLKSLVLGSWERRIYTALHHAPEDDPQTPEDLAHCHWICHSEEQESLLLQHQRNGQHFTFQPSSRMQVDSLMMLADTLARGYGIGILPAWMAECPKHGFKGHFRQVLPEWQASPMLLSLYVRKARLPHRVQALIDHLHRELPERWRIQPAQAS